MEGYPLKKRNKKAPKRHKWSLLWRIERCGSLPLLGSTCQRCGLLRIYDDEDNRVTWVSSAGELVAEQSYRHEKVPVPCQPKEVPR